MSVEAETFVVSSFGKWPQGRQKSAKSETFGAPLGVRDARVMGC
jgi:hypothetical protein